MYLSFSQLSTAPSPLLNSAPGLGISATAVTSYSGHREIVTDYHQGNYRLRDYTRGNGIITLNLRRFADFNSATDFLSPSTNWDLTNVELDQFAVDVHWNTEMVYDFFLNRFNRNSIDDRGFALYSYVHYGVEFDNAFWDGSRMSYGDGLRQPLTTLDLCGHEISHGVTQFTSGLLYKGEAGALNEGFSDIFGTAIEQYARPEKWDWKIGGDIRPSRDLAHPNEFLQPDTYKGTYWYDGADENQFIHRNSSVLGFWFYLLSTGGSGVNDLGKSYGVTAIGIEKATAIAYYTNTKFLFPDARYMDALSGSLRAAEMLYGAGSAELKQTVNAWAAVGLILKPTSPVLASSSKGACAGTKLFIQAGNLNSASDWKWYAGNCGETYLGSGDSIDVAPLVNTVYFARGEGDLSGEGPCASMLVIASGGNTAPDVKAENTAQVCLGADRQYIIPALEIKDGCYAAKPVVSYSVTGATSRSGDGVDASGTFNTGTSTVTWNVKDAAGNITVAQTKVIIDNCNDVWSQWLNSFTGFLQKVHQNLYVSISAYPNPSNNYFTILVSGNGFSPVTVTVRDHAGRIVEIKKGPDNVRQELGRNYHSGIYFAEVLQGMQRVTVKLVRR